MQKKCSCLRNAAVWVIQKRQAATKALTWFAQSHMTKQKWGSEASGSHEISRLKWWKTLRQSYLMTKRNLCKSDASSSAAAAMKIDLPLFKNLQSCVGTTQHERSRHVFWSQWKHSHFSMVFYQHFISKTTLSFCTNLHRKPSYRSFFVHRRLKLPRNWMKNIFQTLWCHKLCIQAPPLKICPYFCLQKAQSKVKAASLRSTLQKCPCTMWISTIQLEEGGQKKQSGGRNHVGSVCASCREREKNPVILFLHCG